MTFHPDDTTLWIHGWASTPAVWAPLQAQLPGRHLTISFHDVNHAGDFPRIVASAIKQSRPDWVIGWSIGGILALEAASKAPWPQLRGIMATGTSPCFISKNHDYGWPERSLLALKQRLLKKPEATLRRFWQQMFEPSEDELHKRFLNEFTSWPSDEFPLPALAAGLDYLCRTDLRMVLSDIPCPVLWLHGGMDRICPIGCLDLTPPAHLSYILPEAGHLPFLHNQQLAINQLDKLFHYDQTRH